ncbi:hypothetical protein E6R18_19715 [Streptomyces sp. A1277]|uniref:hypothetical protein n=1 Tax=Streptomyces sp. A1277 TaxID=2563103 RepID=UPI0010A2088F|nr:hypothetical protein [Streptomyces sp. A1277]THA30593.1 hypothetical protein E6R18_19715 [Streptomyces sp. A1277]
MPAPTFPYLLPWLLAAALLIAADIRERAARKHDRTEAGRGRLDVRWSSAGIFVGASLIGSVLGSLAASEFRAIWVALWAVSFLLVFIALTRLLRQSPGVKATLALSVVAAVASFFLGRGVV